MVEETKTRDTNVKTQLSLAAALFFSPLVQNILKRASWDITDQDKQFIQGYIKFGYITLLFWIIAITTGVLNYLFDINILSITYTISIFILIGLLIISVVSILSDISLIKTHGDQVSPWYAIEGNKKDIILKYLPIYNIYLRYHTHSFDKPNRWIKESLFRWMLFVVSCMMGSVVISSCIIIVIILRIASLMSDIDMFNTKIKYHLNTIFFKNPEEIRWYITGFLRYLAKASLHVFKKMEPYSLDNEIAQEKEIYSRIIHTQDNIAIITEYLVGIAIAIWLIYLIKPDFTVRTYYTWLILIVARYATMAVQLRHLPHLPIARELILLVKGIWSFFKKPFIPKQ